MDIVEQASFSFVSNCTLGIIKTFFSTYLHSVQGIRRKMYTLSVFF